MVSSGQPGSTGSRGTFRSSARSGSGAGGGLFGLQDVEVREGVHVGLVAVLFGEVAVVNTAGRESEQVVLSVRKGIHVEDVGIRPRAVRSHDRDPSGVAVGHGGKGITKGANIVLEIFYITKVKLSNFVPESGVLSD